MKKYYKDNLTPEQIRNKVLGLGEKSFSKSYYPELKNQLSEIEKRRVLLEEKNQALAEAFSEIEIQKHIAQIAEKNWIVTFDAIRDMIFLLDIKGSIIKYNKAFFDFTKADQSTISKNTWNKIIPFKIKDLNEFVVTKAFQSLNRETEIVHFENKHYEFITDPIIEKNQSVGAVCIIKDVTEKVYFQDALINREKMLKDIYTNIPGVIFQFFVNKNNEYGFKFISSKAKEVFNLDITYDTFFNDFCNSLPANKKEDFIQSIAVAVRLKAEWEYEGEFIKKDGNRIWFRANSIPEEIEGELIYNGVIIDLTNQKKAQDELLKTKQKMQATLDAIPDLMFEVDKDGLIFNYYSKYFKNLYARPEDFIGKRVSEFLYDEALEKILKALTDVVQEGSVYGVEYKLKFGENTKWFELSASAIEVNNPETHIICIIRDITDRRNAEIKSKENEDRLRTLINSMPDIVCFKDGEGRWLEANDYDLKLFRLESIDYRGKKDSELAIYSDFYKNAFNTCEDSDEIAWKAGVAVRADKTISCPDESSKTFDIIKVPTFNEDRSRKGLVVVGRDITTRIEIEKELKESEIKYRALFEYANDAILILEGNYIIDCNKTAEEMFRYSKENIFGKTPFDISPEYQKENIKSVQKAEKIFHDTIIEGTQVFEWLHRRSDGEVFESEVSLNTIIISNKKMMQAIIRDITERKQKEKEIEKKNEELERFTYTVSHDLRSPLVTIQAFADYLTDDIKENNFQAIETDIGYIKRAASRMNHLIDELLELSRIGKQINPFVQISLKEIIEEVRDLLAGRIIQRDIRFDVPDDTIIIRGDKPRIFEVFQNLIDNAIKFTQDCDNPLIIISYKIIENKAQITVKDNGIGIEEKHINKLFGIFEKLNPDIEGSGVGLAIVKRIVEYHEGEITVKSEGLGKGTEFIFTLKI